MDSSPSRTKTTTTGRMLEPSLPSTKCLKRPASLLPAFEPLSSSPGLPRPSKRQATAAAFTKYPTPVPTSSTGILSSSPPRVGPRPSTHRIPSVSERAPLSDVRSVELSEAGEPLLMGRSSNSSHYQLSSNRLISRVHVKARYILAADGLQPNRIEIVCNGWNGLKLHCEGQTWELGKGDSFVSETEGAELMIDVQDARVLVQWPKKDLGHYSPDSAWDESPRRVVASPDSPPRRAARIASPVSPTPANISTSNADLSALLPDEGDVVQIYEDASDDELELPKLPDVDPEATFVAPTADSFSSDLSEPLSDAENNPDEENDPIVHSFGPFGANLSNRLASFSTFSPKLARISQSPISRSSTATVAPDNAESPKVEGSAASTAAAAILFPVVTNPLNAEETAIIVNHVINQLAFSRLSSTPLSTIMSKLPAEEKKDLEKEQLRVIIESTSSVGIIRRQGKDAAGKQLETEYYYVPEMDADDQRRLAVTDGLRKPSLRNCRKQHKQYYWKRPRTP
ncbi:hypothetical protein B0T25DRAFT_179413 [Lasiosphaeria hispida]|uniref:FHA domain-containing protein n=1 Tax=Lasiosphaeria hispida TaxID=260671 RepID=A0AAJ0HGI2_9PEZI|nr:hypothetical protein B0T25DRAFT_179413 [Lasiosphaeria hispida]